jgi:hypothetical protein
VGATTVNTAALGPVRHADRRQELFDKASGLYGMAVGGLEGYQVSNQIDADMSYAGNVSFQSNGDANRAVIQMAQLQYDQDTGKVVPNPFRTYGVIDEDGEINRYYRPPQ